MSQWTHVAGIIRIDSMQEILGPEPDTTEKLLRESLGYTWDYNDTESGDVVIHNAIDLSLIHI